MDINVDWKKYSEKLLKKMERQLKEAIKAKENWKIEELKKDIENHKERYSDYLK